MGTTFEKCGPDEYEMLDGLMRDHRDDLVEVNARISLLFASSDKPGVPAIKHHGFAVAGRAKVNSYQDRVEGKGDATITLDKERWDRYTPARRMALLHHELSHIAGPPADNRFDALGRPRLRLVPGDFENDGFFEVIRLYGQDAPEKRWLDTVLDGCKQLLLPMGERVTIDAETVREAIQVQLDETFADGAAANGVDPGANGQDHDAARAGKDKNKVK